MESRPRRWSYDDIGSAQDMSPNEGTSLKSENTNGTGNSCDTVTDVVHVSQPAPAVTTKSSMANVAPEKVRLGIACMSKKMNTATMQAFIQRFEQFGRFTVIPFAEQMILEDPIELWPHVDCAIVFNSSGFPLQKACDYYSMHKRDTYFLTEPESQKVLLDRRDFYEAMSLNNIPLPPNHVFCNRDGYRGASPSTVEEFDDYIIIDGRRLDKPFVEKPVDAEDHAVFIYYPASMGGGCRQMFRKVKNQSSQFVPDCNRIRREGSYLYESFVNASLTDIKCYTVGPNFVYAEARKAPTVDGVVDRDAKGKEVRVTVPLYPAELMVARKVIKVFRQMVCGFDILRASDTEFYVCDVNGWSFVKNNDEYVDRAAAIMRDIFLEEVGKRGLHRVFRRMATPRELMGVVGVFRHADRTPKQKLKLNISSERILRCAFEGAANQRDEVVFKGEHPKLDELESVLEAELLREASLDSSKEPPSPKKEVEPCEPTTPLKQKEKIKDGKSKQKGRSRTDILQLMKEVLSRRQEGLKMQVKPKCINERGECCEAQLVCKWGGWITKAGERQAQNVGQNFVDRVFGHECGAMYLRDVHVSTNNERRVISTARNFVDYVTHHRNTVIPVDEPLLGDNSNAKEALEHVNAEVSKIMHCDDPVEAQNLCGRFPGMEAVLHNFVLSDDERTPLRALKRLHALVSEVVSHVNNSWKKESAPLHRNEPLVLLRQRWTNLMKSLVLSEENEPMSYDVTKLTDVFDYVSYDVCYNQKAFHPIDLYPLFTLAQPVSAFVAEYENGLDRSTKLLTGALIGEPLLRRIYSDLVAIARASVPRTRLYFTSASHVNALRNMLYCSDATAFHRLGEPLELHFLSHFVFKVYRYRKDDPVDPSPPANPFGSPTNSEAGNFPTPPKFNRHTSVIAPQYSGIHTQAAAHDGSSPSSTTSPALEKETFQIEVHFSTGVDKNMFGIVQGHHAQYGAVSPMIRIHNNLTFREFLDIVRQCQSLYEDATKTTLPAVPDHGRSLSTPVATDFLNGAAPLELPEGGNSFPPTPDHNHEKSSVPPPPPSE